jgi:hypothetical protein
MGVGFLLVEVGLDEFFRGLERIRIFLALGLHGYFVPDFVLNNGLVFLPSPHDVGQDVLLPVLGESYSDCSCIVDGELIIIKN